MMERRICCPFCLDKVWPENWAGHIDAFHRYEVNRDEVLRNPRGKLAGIIRQRVRALLARVDGGKS